ncbi:MAG: transposase [Aestuariibacter sp.]|nr:transposase [Aestuariibacter sp.]
MPELAEVFQRFGYAYLDKYHENMLASHKRAIIDILHCRTEALGGEVMLCRHCGAKAYKYHSCKNRSCPKCQNDQTDQWLDKQRACLLPTAYFMATFTLPGLLRTLTRSQQETLYGILFTASQQALRKLAKDPKYIGGEIGMLGVLQTWRRDLGYHPHIHYIIPGGGLAPDGVTWRPARHDYLMPEKALAIIFRAKFRDLLMKTNFYDQVSPSVWKQSWCVDIEPVGDGQSVLKYLAPYIYRVAISNKNILNVTDTHVTFRYHESKNKGGAVRTKTLPAENFMQQFLQHVLPKGFRKVRTYGLWHHKKRDQLELIKEQLQPEPIQTIAPDGQPKTQEVTPPAKRPFKCKDCGQAMIVLDTIQRRGPPLLLWAYSQTQTS